MTKRIDESSDFDAVSYSGDLRYSQSAIINPNLWSWYERTWNLKVVEVDLATDSQTKSALHGAFFLNSRGDIWTPPYMPHIPLVASFAQGGGHHHHTNEWLKLGDSLCRLLRQYRFANSIVLPPSFLDGRPFAWANYRCELAYTYLIQFPRERKTAISSVRRHHRKAERAGYRASRSDDWQMMLACLEATSSRKSFPLQLSVPSLRLAADLIGDDAFRGYVARDSNGVTSSVIIVLHLSEHCAVYLAGGNESQGLRDGAPWLLFDYVFDDLLRAGATGIDLFGANNRSVALSKSNWGYPLVPQIRISSDSLIPAMRRTYADSIVGRALRRLARR